MGVVSKGDPYTHLELQKEDKRESSNQGGSKKDLPRDSLALPQSAQLGNK